MTRWTRRETAPRPLFGVTRGNSNMVDRYDAVILGGGNAGFGASAVLHEAGKSIAFVEDWDFGGTQLYRQGNVNFNVNFNVNLNFN